MSGAYIRRLLCLHPQYLAIGLNLPVRMYLAAWVAAMIQILSWPVNARLAVNGLDQIETNVITADEPPKQLPQPSRLGTQQENHWVKISEAPPSVINARLGDRLEIECEAIGSPAPEIQWIRGERSISQGRKQPAKMLAEKAGLAKMKSRLILDCITRKHEGFYICTASAGGHTIKASPTLLIIDGIGQGGLDMCSNGQRHSPRIVEWTPTAMEMMGQNVRLPCLAVGTPNPTIYWLDPQNNLINSYRHQVSEDGDLTISLLDWSDMGEYTCVAESSEGRDAVTTFIYPLLDTCQSQIITAVWAATFIGQCCHCQQNCQRPSQLTSQN